eukprot:681549-Alexandrium_andersonii.AAC.1
MHVCLCVYTCTKRSLALAQLGRITSPLLSEVSMDRNCPDGYVETTAASLRDTEAFIQHTQARGSALMSAL